MFSKSTSGIRPWQDCRRREEDLVDETPDVQAGNKHEPVEEYEFLLPGPTPETNEGCLGWGASWAIFSVFLILVIALVTVGCYFLSVATGIV